MAAAESSTSASCHAHPERPAAATCARCGVFVCTECRSASGSCADCAFRDSLPAGRWQANAARGLLWLNVGTRGIDVIVAGAYYLGWVPHAATGFVAELTTAAVTVAQVSYFVTAVPFLWWWHTMVERLEARKFNLGSSPSAAVGAWFTPFVNLEKPYAIARAAVTALGVEAPVGWWWLFFIGRAIFAIAAGVLRTGNASSVAALSASLLFELSTVVAAVLCIRVISVIQDALTRPQMLRSAAASGVLPP